MTIPANKGTAQPRLSDAKIKQEAFEQWLIHPVTVAMMAKAQQMRESYKKEWDILSWQLPVDALPSRLTTERLAYLRGKSAVAKSLLVLKWSNLLKEETADE